jgi:hypothetical protein
MHAAQRLRISQSRERRGTFGYVLQAKVLDRCMCSENGEVCGISGTAVEPKEAQLRQPGEVMERRLVAWRGGLTYELRERAWCRLTASQRIDLCPAELLHIRQKRPVIRLWDLLEAERF